MAGWGGRAGAGRAAGGAVLNRQRDANVRAAINGSGGQAPYAINNIQRTNRLERDLRAISQLPLPRWVKTGMRNRANIMRANRQISRANRYIGTEGRYTTPRAFREAVGRSYRQLENSARVAAKASDYILAQRQATNGPRNSIRPAIATKAGRAARLAKFRRQQAALGSRFALNSYPRRGIQGGNGIRRFSRNTTS